MSFKVVIALRILTPKGENHTGTKKGISLFERVTAPEASTFTYVRTYVSNAGDDSTPPPIWGQNKT